MALTEFESGRSADKDITDINTKAYKNVQNAWTKRRVWNENQGLLPRILWKHEKPLDEDYTYHVSSVNYGARVPNMTFLFPSNRIIQMPLMFK